MGAVAPLLPDDYISSTHRGHGHVLAKGANMNRMLAEIMGKETGDRHGRGGSMHIADVNLNIIVAKWDRRRHAHRGRGRIIQPVSKK